MPTRRPRQRKRVSQRKGQGRETLLERMWDKIDVKDSIEECWEWLGGGTKFGYGTIHIEMLPDGSALRRSVTSVLYETTVGPFSIDEHGNPYEPDHLCRWPRCANPFHLEEVTHEENVHRASPTVCPHGHEYTPENTYTDSRGARHCRRCNAQRAKIRNLGLRQKLQPYDKGRLEDVVWYDDGSCIMVVKMPRVDEPVLVSLTAEEASAIVG